MRRFLLFVSAAAMLVAVSCAKEEVQNIVEKPVVNEEPTVEKVKWVISASVPQTKTVVESDGTYKWVNGDAIKVFDAEGELLGKFTVSNLGEPASTADFVEDIDKGKTPKYAVYPYNESASCTSEGVISTVIPTEQDGTIASAISCATSTDGKNFTFTNAVSVIKLNFKVEDNICGVSVQFKDNVTGNVSLSGGATVSNATSKIVSVKGNSAFDGPVYLAIAPAEQKEIVLTFTNLDGQNAMLNASVKNGFAAGNVKSLGTVSGLTFQNTADLSTDGTANCYIVPAKGAYRFNASVKGNSTTDIITPASVEYLWSTFNTATAPNTANEIVKAVSLGADGYATFETTGVSGNVIVAARDAEDNIIWSWHLWIPKDDIHSVLHKKTGATMNGTTMLNANLGALTTSYSPDDARDLGFFYQWGRKDPFVSASIRTTTAPRSIPYAAVHGEQKIFENRGADGKSVDFTVSHPTHFICSTDDAGNQIYESGYKDWNTSATKHLKLWDNVKTIYDPCPPGYVVPRVQSGPWGYFSTGSPWDNTKHGRLFTNTQNEDIWHPAAGFLHRCSGKYSGSINSLGENGGYWGTDDDAPGDKRGYKAYNYFWYMDSSSCAFNIDSDSVDKNSGRGTGRSVRCCKEGSFVN